MTARTDRPTRPIPRTAMTALWLTAAVATAAVGLLLRLVDPLSSPVVPAEDPYTHMALVRGHLFDGTIDPLFEGGSLYPPGLHALLAATWVYTGADLYDIFRVGPVVLGVVGVVGVAVLLWRFAGPLAAVVGGLAAAVAPELIFRTTMMAPTALDLAILPAFLFAALMTLRGNPWWSGVVLVVAGFLVTSHPWALAVLGPVVLGLVVLSVLFSRPEHRPTALGVSALLLATGAALLLSISVCWDQCGLGFQSIDSPTFSASLDQGVAAVAAVCVLGGAAVLVLRDRLDRVPLRLAERPPRLWVRFAASAAVAAAAVAVTVPAVVRGMPMHVDLPRMFGWPILGLAALGLAALPFLRSPAANAGAAVMVVTYPFVVHAPFSDPNWPHRTAAFLGVGLVLMTGASASALARWTRDLSHRAGRGAAHGRPWRVTAGAAASLLVGTTLVGGVYAGTPDEYESGWYRLYSDCEFNHLRELAESADGDTILVTGSWESKLVLAAFADDPTTVWYHYEYYAYEHERVSDLEPKALEGKKVVMVVDRHLESNHADIDRSFLENDPWVPVGAWCANMGLPQPRLKAYRMEVGA